MFPSYDNERFIGVIRNYPAIWDNGTAEYGDRNQREQVWLLVGKSMFEDWSKMKTKEKHAQVKEMKNKWRNIRDSYAKYISQGKNRTRKKKYIYADALSFLYKTINKKKTDRFFDNSEQPKDTDQNSFQMNGDSEDTEVMQIMGQTGLASDFLEQRIEEQGLTEFQSKLLDKLDAKLNDGDNGDKLFLMSVLPQVSRLSEEEKLDFRLHVLNFFKGLKKDDQASSTEECLIKSDTFR